MALRFQWKDIPHRERGLTFDDVLIVPKKSNIKSRKDPSLKSKLTKNTSLDIPIVSANMDTITESDMAIAMAKKGGLGIIHRFLPLDVLIKEVQKLKNTAHKTISASIGVSGDWKERSKALVDAGVNILTIDIAHGHSTAMVETLKYIKDTYDDVEVIAGNIATPEAADILIETGADAIKVGIGPGSMCTTRVITGCGVPQLTAIALCSQVAIDSGVPVIADGGIKTSGDIVKALVCGADTVMLGSMLAGTIETPGEIKKGHKEYRGMASKAAQVTWRGQVPAGMAAEGESTKVPVKGHVSDVISEICGGIRSGMSYINVSSIPEMKEQTELIEISSSGTYESRAHGLGL